MLFPPKENHTEFMWVKDCGIESYSLNGKRYISRIISTDPKKYLDPDYTPGRELKS
jgi:hypothetical protein